MLVSFGSVMFCLISKEEVCFIPHSISMWCSRCDQRGTRLGGQKRRQYVLLKIVDTHLDGCALERSNEACAVVRGE